MRHTLGIIAQSKRWAVASVIATEEMRVARATKRKVMTCRTVVVMVVFMGVLYQLVVRKSSPRKRKNLILCAGLTLGLRGPAVAAVDVVRRSKEAVGNGAHLCGVEGHANLLVTDAQDVRGGGADSRCVDTHGVRAHRDDERSTTVTFKGDAGVVAAVGDLAFANGDIAFRGAEEVRGARGGVDDRNGVGESGAGHA